jgi:hypothetical protein
MKTNLLIILLCIFYFNAYNQKTDINDIGFTPTLIFMGMYGLAYSRAVDNNHIITGIGGYTNFDLSPVPFLHNDEWKYQNVYLGINYTIFPFSEKMFPRGFYYGFDYVPSIGIWVNRETNEKAIELGNSADMIAGYSWVFWDKLKLSADLFLNFNIPGISLKGDAPSSKLVILPFFDINIGLIF